ncbi:murein biosynthesis integral membrane protein MurJ [Rhodovulum sp. DZ06]|uniref:murein biosynthesis integral membrane protein MurJ n=1 Tax=Rhodovulum sp. DZ06 TaxID=3425126 RepID=UPI003D327D31
MSRLFRAFATVGGWTMASRILGFARDIAIAAALGAGPAAEAFVIAFSLPNLFRRFFAEGAFNMAFVPMFTKKLDGEGDAPARAFAEDAMAGLASVLVVLTLVAMAAMPWMVLGLASGFADDGRLALATDYGRVAFPYILFISIAALLSGVLNALDRFAAAAAAPVLLNVILLAALGLAALFGLDDGRTLVWGVAAAGVAQMAMLWRAAAKAGMRLRLRRPRMTPELKRLAIIAAPAALAGGVVQINLVVGRQVASHFDGAVAWLYYADRLYQLPLGVVGVAIGVVLLPDLSRRLRQEDELGGRAAANRAAEFALALTLPAAIALAAIPGPLVSVLFGRGAFGPEDAEATALACAVYGLGLPAFVLQKVLQPIYFAREDTRTPFKIALWGMAANLVLAIGLAPVIGFLSAAVATTAAGWINLAMLYRGARGFGQAARPDARLIARTPRILAASLLMGLGAWALAGLSADVLAAPGLRILALGLIVAAAMAIYFAAAAALGGLSVSELKGMVRRGR